MIKANEEIKKILPDITDAKYLETRSQLPYGILMKFAEAVNEKYIGKLSANVLETNKSNMDNTNNPLFAFYLNAPIGQGYLFRLFEVEQVEKKPYPIILRSFENSLSHNVELQTYQSFEDELVKLFKTESVSSIILGLIGQVDLTLDSKNGIIQESAEVANLSKQIKQLKDETFFTKDDLLFFSEWQYKPYDAYNPEHVSAKNHLLGTVWDKTVELGNRILRQLKGYKMEGRRIWSQRGWKNVDGENVQAAIFKPYTWVKIFREKDDNKDIFFTFGLDASPQTQSFVYKIDCQFMRDSELTEDQIEKCKELIPASAKWNEIDFDTLLEYNWDSLTAISVDFIKKFENTYDTIINAVWGARNPEEQIQSVLFKRSIPKYFETINEVKSKIEDDALIQRANLGDIGEELVRLYEISYLKSIGRNLEAEKVKIVMNQSPSHFAYDVLSFDEQGNEKYILVKATIENLRTPFYLSTREYDFLNKNRNKACIYRLYNFNLNRNTADFFQITSDTIEQFVIGTSQFKVTLKDNS